MASAVLYPNSCNLSRFTTLSGPHSPSSPLDRLIPSNYTSLRIIRGDEYQGYEEALGACGTEWLQVRRTNLFCIFGEKCLKTPKHLHSAHLYRKYGIAWIIPSHIRQICFLIFLGQCALSSDNIFKVRTFTCRVIILIIAREK